jgi:predicted dehydrogenase
MNTRRKFLQSTTGLLAANTILLEASAAPQETAPSDRVRFGIVGIGMQGTNLLNNAISIPGAECVAAADLYDGRHLHAREIAGNPNLPVTRNYIELLNRKDIDCIIAAVPDFHHKHVVVNTCNAGKDIYCEKPMTHTAEEGFDMASVAKENNRIVQIGSQRVSGVVFGKARELYSSGAIGDVSMVELSLGRNDPTGAWQYPPPLDLSPENLSWDAWLYKAPKIPFNPERFARWRCWKEYGTGVGGDLMVHLITGMLYTLGWNEAPRSASALGGIVRWRDGRNMPDLHTVLFDYHGVPVYVRLTLGTETPETTRIMGPKGVLTVTGSEVRFSPQLGIERSPSYYSSSFPSKMHAQYVAQWHAAHDAGLPHSAVPEDTVYLGNGEDEGVLHMRNFFQSVKSRKPVLEDAVFGNHAALACHMANESYFRKSPVTLDSASQTIRSS